jgi:pimeloyl-ACP methyl ester carboxylesterase
VRVNTRTLRSSVHALVLVAIAASGCAESQYDYRGANYDRRVEEGTVLRSLLLDPATEKEILALDPEHLSEREIRDVLSLGPAPRIINLHGSLPVVTMRSFSEFLIAMGYPEEKVRKTKGGAYSYSSYGDSRQLAGLLAWYYEKEGIMPILVGHSQGGMLAIKVLHELAGAFGGRIPLWSPLTEAAEDRFTLIDPISGTERTVIGLKVRYAAAIATGKLMRVVLGQWGMVSRIRKIPDSVEEFTGFSIEMDLLAADFLDFTEEGLYRPLGSARVRNVRLPSGYSHITAPLAKHLAAHPVTRDWINQYVPGSEMPPLRADPGVDGTNILLAADLWYSIKKHWCLEAQRLIGARRNLFKAKELG